MSLLRTIRALTMMMLMVMMKLRLVVVHMCIVYDVITIYDYFRVNTIYCCVYVYFLTVYMPYTPTYIYTHIDQGQCSESEGGKASYH